MLLLLPFSLSGAVRYVLGTGFPLSLAIAAVPAALAGAAAVRWGMPRVESLSDVWTGVALLGVSASLVALTFRLWWDPLFAGMPNALLGVDVGNHLLLYQRFLELGSKQYEGFVGLYAVMHWYRRLFGWDLGRPQSIYYALRFAHYAFLLALPIAAALVVYPVLTQVKSRPRAILTALLSLPVQAIVFSCLVFTPVQYYQADGFYSQIAGLYPVVLGWLSYGLLERAEQRLIVCCGWIVVQRFTYGLNLGDTLATLAYLWLWETPAFRPPWLRRLVPVLALGALAASVLVFSKLWPLRVMPGYFMAQHVPWILGAQLVGSVALAAAAPLFTHVGIAVSDASRRLWRYAAVFALINGCLTALYFAYDQPFMYYILKYSLYAVVLLCLALVGPLATLMAQLVREPHGFLDVERVRLALGALVLAGVVFGGVAHGYLPQRALALERYERPALNKTLFSNYQEEIATFIEQVTAKQGKSFGGYYDPHWPRMFVHNALYFLFAEQPDHHYNREFLAKAAMFMESPGRCYFMTLRPSDYAAPPATPMGRQLRKFHADRGECTSFVPAWGQGAFELCATCY